MRYRISLLGSGLVRGPLTSRPRRSCVVGPTRARRCHLPRFVAPSFGYGFLLECCSHTLLGYACRIALMRDGLYFPLSNVTYVSAVIAAAAKNLYHSRSPSL